MKTIFQYGGGLFSLMMIFLESARVNGVLGEFYLTQKSNGVLYNSLPYNLFDHIFEQRDFNNELLCNHHIILKDFTVFKEYYPKYRQIVDCLVLKQEIIDYTDTSIIFKDKIVLVVHIRLTNFNNLHANDYGAVNFVQYIDKINEILNNNDDINLIYVASDNVESIIKLKQIYGDKIICNDSFIRYPHEVTTDGVSFEIQHSHNPEFFKQAMIEAIMLSKCNYSIGRASNLYWYSLLMNQTINDTDELTQRHHLI